MISLSKLLVKKSEYSSAHLQLLLDGIAKTAVEAAGYERSALQRELGQISSDLEGAANSELVALQIAKAVQLMDRHNRSTEVAVAAQQKELRCMIAATTDTIAAIGSSSKDGVEHLRKLENSLEGAANADDLRLLRNRLFACLTLVRNESLRVQLESEKLTRSLKSVMLKASSQLVPGTDGTTGLPGPDAVTKSVYEILSQGEPFSAAIFVLTDLKSWNTRLGRHAGDEILQLASESLRSQFGAEEATYRWNGPAFLVTRRGDEGILGQFEAKARQIARAGLEISLVVEGKLKMLPIAIAWIVQRFAGNTNTEQVMRTLEECTNTLQSKP